MAAYTCDEGDGLGAAYTVTRIEDGETFMFCGAHFLAWCAALVAGVADGAEPTGEGGEAPKSDAGTIAAEEETEAAEPASSAGEQR